MWFWSPIVFLFTAFILILPSHGLCSWFFTWHLKWMGFSFLTDIFHINIRQKKPHDTSPPTAQKSFGNCMPGFLMTLSRAEGFVEDIFVKSEVRYSWSHSLANQRGSSPPQSSSLMSPEKSKSPKRQNAMGDTGQQFFWCPQFLPAVVPPAWSPQSHQVKAAPSSPKPSALMVNAQRYIMQSSPSTNWGTVPTLCRPSDRQTVPTHTVQFLSDHRPC